MSDRPRVTPVSPRMVDDEVADLLSLTESADGEPLRVIATLANRPDLVGPFLTWSTALAGPGELTARAHELVALRTAWRHRSDYEWGHHVAYARRDGVTDAEVQRVAEAGLEGWAEVDRVLLEVVDAMCAGGVDDATWAAAADHHAAAALVELAWTVGQYASLSMITEALRVVPEPGLEACPPGGADDVGDSSR